LTWPRLWRLWSEPRPGSMWWADGSPREVWYVEGAPGERVVVARIPVAPLLVRPVRMSLWAWRCWWVFAREVRP
jgi:hypothetical protein